jgi:acetylornithine/succinyldiaminopimelate/putrescine aminotransferase
MERIDAPGLARQRGAQLTERLQRLPKVASVRGSGLLLGAELEAGVDAKAVSLELLDRGLVTNAVTATALRLAPPLTVSEAEIDEAASMIAEVLG